jgi:ATP-dependent DNA helicase RecG
LKTPIFGTKSVVRNPVIASLLHRAGYIEKIGTGIRRIEYAVKEHGKGIVTFSFDSFFTVFFSRVKATEKTSGKTAPKIGKATQETTQEIEETIEETIQETTQEMILRLIKTNPAITRKGLAEKAGLTPDGVKYHLDKLREQGVIRHVGATKKGYWEVMENYE